LEKIVFSNSLTHAPRGQWGEAKIENVDPISRTKILKATPGKNIMVWGSISIAQLLMKNQLVDEYHTLICPMLTGGGKRLFAKSSDEISLSLKECINHDNGVVFLNYDINSQKTDA
jgi:dihydrofolate reductase